MCERYAYMYIVSILGWALVKINHMERELQYSEKNAWKGGAASQQPPPPLPQTIISERSPKMYEYTEYTKQVNVLQVCHMYACLMCYR